MLDEDHLVHDDTIGKGAGSLETKGQAEACPDQTRAIPCKVRLGLLPDGLRLVDSNDDSNSNDQRQAAATGDSTEHSHDP